MVSIPFAAAYALARERMAGVPSAGAGYRLFWVRQGEVGWVDLLAGGAYAVLGCHERCDVILDGAGIALRHLLAATIELADGLALRLLDLQTGVQFFIADGTPQTSIVASGPVVVRLGGYVLGAVPLEGEGTGQPVLPDALPEAVVTENTSLPATVRPPLAASALAAHESAYERPRSTLIASMPPPASLAAPQRPSPGAGRAASGPLSMRLTLLREGRSASVELSEGELEVGVVVGRTDQCHYTELQEVLDTSVSRGHLLLLRHHSGLEAFDLCSMQGTYAKGRKVRRLPLHDEEVPLRLACISPVTLRWQKLPAPGEASTP